MITKRIVAIVSMFLLALLLGGAMLPACAQEPDRANAPSARADEKSTIRQRAIEFTDEVWGEVDRWLDRWTIAERERRAEPGETPRFGSDEDPRQNAPFFYDFFEYGYGGYCAPAADRPGYVFQYYDSNADGYYDYVVTLEEPGDGEKRANQSAEFSYFDMPPPAEPPQPDPLRRTTIQGLVGGTKVARTPQGDHFLLSVREPGENGATLVVDAGFVTEQLSAIDAGAELQATGRMIKVGPKDLLVADTLEINGRPVELAEPFRPLEGRVVDVKTVVGSDGPHQFVIVEADGQHHWVDVGNDPNSTTALQPGERYTFFGAPVYLRDRPVFHAHAYRYHDETNVVWRGLGQYVDTSPLAPTYSVTIEVMLGTKALDDDAQIDTIELSGVAYQPVRDGNRFRIASVPAGNYLLTIKGFSATRKPILGQKEIVLTGAGSKTISIALDYER